MKEERKEEGITREGEKKRRCWAPRPSSPATQSWRCL